MDRKNNNKKHESYTLILTISDKWWVQKENHIRPRSDNKLLFVVFIFVLLSNFTLV